MKVLWYSNKRLTSADKGSTGTWLDSLSLKLAVSEKVVVGNVTTANVDKLTYEEVGSIKQWLIPLSKGFPPKGLPPASIIKGFINATDQFKPELIHVWGTESYKGLLTARKLVDYPSLLETQGIIQAIAHVYSGGLSFNSKIKCAGIKEVLKRDTIWHGQNRFKNWSKYESEIINGHSNITVQSHWLEAQVKAINSKAKIYHNDFLLRDPFYRSEKWLNFNKTTILCSSAYSSPFKGFHDLINALRIVKNTHPNVQLRIAGNVQLRGIKRDGYSHFIEKLIEKEGLKENVIWLGALNGAQLVNELTSATMYVIPSYVEGYSLALAEAMYIGTPCVCAFNGGTSHLAKDGDSALFYQPGDIKMCAYQINKLIEENDTAKRLSKNSISIAEKRSSSKEIVNQQIEIYRNVIHDFSCKQK
jgi:glycosyltransferase involved in cell wall biosynthesis